MGTRNDRRDPSAWDEEVSFAGKGDSFLEVALMDFCNHLQDNIATKDLQVEGILLAPTSTAQIAKALHHNCALLHLSIRRCAVGDAGAQTIAEMLRVNECLQSLDLHDNEFSDEGGRLLAQALEHNSVISSFVISKNRLGERSAEALARVIRSNTTLRTLGLATNRITQKGADALVAGLSESVSITSLNLDGNEEISYDTLLEVKRGVSDNRVAIKQAYYDLIKKKQKAQPWYRTKLMVVGQGRSGKSATIRSLLNRSFDPTLASTVGIALTETLAARSSGWVEQNTDDISSFTAAFAAAAIATRPKPVQKRKAAARKGRLKTPSRPPAHKPFVPATKPAAFEEPYRYKDTLFTNARNQVRLLVWDYGGQEVFHSLHHLFLTTTGLYLVVFSLAEYAKNARNTAEHVRFWLNSIHLQAPNSPILCVGTFADEVESQSQMVDLIEEFERYKEQFPQIISSSESQVFYTIDNRSRQGIASLRSAILHTAARTEDFGKKVPTKWMQCFDEVMRSTTKGWMSREELRSKAAPIGIIEEEELEDMLQVFHQFGIVLYFSSTEALKDTVITDPKWLITEVGKLIRDRDQHPFDTQRAEEAGLSNDLKILLTTAVASHDLLSLLWEKTKVEYLKDLLQSLLLIGEWNLETESPGYLVPSMLLPKRDASTLTSQAAKIKFQFLPNGVFARVICCLVGVRNSKEVATPAPELYAQECKIWFDASSAVYLQRLPSELVVLADPLTKSTLYLQVVLTALHKIRVEVFRSSPEFKWEVFVVSANKEEVRYKEAIRRKMKPWHEVAPGERSEVKLFDYLEG